MTKSMHYSSFHIFVKGTEFKAVTQNMVVKRYSMINIFLSFVNFHLQSFGPKSLYK